MSTDTLIGLILMLAIGPAIGNYATSVVYRLPRGQTPFEKHPYCGSCNTLLAPRDLFPIWSYVFLRGKCRYCAATIPPTHTAIELACGLIFVFNFLAFGISETFLLLTAWGVFMVILAGLEWHEKRLFPLILTFCFFLAAMHRLLQDASLYPMIRSGFICFFVVIAACKLGQLLRGMRLRINPENTHYRIPHAAIYAALCGIALPLPEAFYAMLLASFLYGVQRVIWKISFKSAAATLAIWLVLLAG